jgi:hypothetical protein
MRIAAMIARVINVNPSGPIFGLPTPLPDRGPLGPPGFEKGLPGN